MAPRIGPLSVAGRLRGATLLIVAASFLVLPAGAPAAVVGGVGTIYMTDQESDGGSGTLFSVDGTNGDREVVSENGNPGGQPVFSEPRGVAIEASPPPNWEGTSDWALVVADPFAGGGSGAVIRVDPDTGIRSLVSKNGSPGGAPRFDSPEGIAVESDGDILVSDTGCPAVGPGGGGICTEGRIIRVDPDTGARTLVTDNVSMSGPLLVDPSSIGLESGSGDIIVVDGNLNYVAGGGVARVDPVTGDRTLISDNATPVGTDFDVPVGIEAHPPLGEFFVTDAEAFGGGGAVFGVDSVNITRRTVSENANPAGPPEFTSPTDIAKQASGGQYVVSDADYGINTGGAVIRVHPTTGIRTVISASDPAALSFVQVGAGPDFAHPSDIVVRSLSIFSFGFNPAVIHTFPLAVPKASAAESSEAKESSKAKVSFRLTNAADVTYTVERIAKSGSATDLGSITKPAKRGLNRRPFTAKFKGKPLAPGLYRLTLQAKHPKLDDSSPVSAEFRVKRG